MTKPTIFFSHSSRDKDLLLVLKNLLLAKTSNTIEIFQSSDGESIPFGNNWVSKIEENLKNAKIMFVFVTPNSLKSNWIYFEAGFSYSKGVKVIPLGIAGVDIAFLPPPINLLQGFNITSSEGMNNIVDILNREFHCSFLKDFSDIQFQQMIGKATGGFNLTQSMKYIDHIEADIISNLKDNPLNENSFIILENLLKESGYKFSKSGNHELLAYGIRFSHVQRKKSENTEIEVDFDALKMKDAMELICELLKVVYKNEVEKFWLHIVFDSNVKLLSTIYKLSARLSSVGVEVFEKNGRMFVFRGLLFGIDELGGRENRLMDQKRLRVVFNTGNYDSNDISDLIETLFSIDVISKKDS